MALLEGRDLIVRYGALAALDNVSVAIEAGEFVSVIGPNGAGKTTLVNVLTGLQAPDTGSVSFAGQDITGIGAQQLAILGLARSFQLIAIFPELTVRETLLAAVISRQRKGGRLLASLQRDRAARWEAEEVAALFGLDANLHTKAGNLSQGDKKLLDVASAFALHPQVILLDEPTSGVSTRDKHRIMDILVSASQQIGIRTTLQVEHDMDIVFAYSDRIIAMHEGRVLFDGTPAAIQRDEEVVARVMGHKEIFSTFRRQP
ncbi:ABC transporter ATP-binding protein [Candidatus Entotheonella palauensis]|uniref:ABC transporter ATP-binding protein n=1 Tax=Candidatus Entotheonella palauensis TaxID=93172 RepID=UPI000B7FAD99|nr:ABC transporter ATP-binding protein [Candidatus Entotheonella palauensis]